MAYSLYFGNTTALATVSANAAFQSLTALTIEAYVYVTTNAPTYPSRIVDNNAFTTAGYNFELNSAGLQMNVSNGTSLVSLQGSNISINVRHHIAGMWDGSNVYIFSDGKSIGSGTLAAGNTGNPAASLYIGNTSGNIRGFPGYIENLRISKIARYSTSGFTAPNTPLTSDSNTVGLWLFNEGTGTTAYDSSSNNLTATLSGSQLPVWSGDLLPNGDFLGLM